MLIGSPLGNFVGDNIVDVELESNVSLADGETTYTWTFTNPYGTIGNHSIKDADVVVYGNSPQVFSNIDTNNVFVMFYGNLLVGPMRDSSGGLQLHRVTKTVTDIFYILKRKYAEPFFRNTFIGKALRFSGGTFRNGHN